MLGCWCHSGKELHCCVTLFWCTTLLVILLHALLYKLVTLLYFVTVLYFLGLFVTLQLIWIGGFCEWDWRILFSVDKMIYLVFIILFFCFVLFHFGFFPFFSFFFPSVDFEPHIRNTSETIKNCVKCNCDVKLISNHYFIFSSIVNLCFGFEVINNIKFILYSFFRKYASLMVYSALQIPM